MDILIRYVNIYTTCWVIGGFIVLIVTAVIYTIQKNQRKHHIRLRLKLIKAYNKSVKNNDSTIFTDTISKTLSSDLVKVIVRFFAQKQRSDVHDFISFFDGVSFQKKLRKLLKKGTTQQSIDAANMLSYYPSEQTFNALDHACLDSRQEVAIAAALSLVLCNPNVSLAQLIVKLFNSIPQKDLFCFLRLVPSHKLLELESQVRNEELVNPNSNLITMLREISNNYITPFVAFAKEDQRDYMQSLFEMLLTLQYKASGIIHSCYILNYINEFCYQKKLCSVQELITKYFNFDTKLFISFLEQNNNIFKIKIG